MWKDVKENYRLAGTFCLALPLVVAFPVAVEAVQHIVEWRIGMFESAAAASAVEAHPARTAISYVKIGALFVTCWWVWRFLGFAGDRQAALRRDGFALKRFAVVLLSMAAITLVEGELGKAVSAYFEAPRHVLLAAIGMMLAGMAVELYLAPWKVGAAMGDRNMTLVASLRAMRGNIGWSFAFTVIMFFPIMILHYVLGLLPIALPPAPGAVLLVLDSALVGYLAVLFPTTVFMVARRAGEQSQARSAAGAPLQALQVPA